jgi:predicted solute-binding protein
MPKTALAVNEALYLRPLLQGLGGPSSPFDLAFDIPANNALKLRERTGAVRCAFLSPIDYARHGGEYCIVPNIAVSSERSTETIQLFVNENVRSINTMAVDVRVTSEIILAKIILIEKFRNTSLKEGSISFIPMFPDVEAMLKKADAALIVNERPPMKSVKFRLDLVEEWNDLTGLPYVHGFWVTREADFSPADAQELLLAQARGVNMIEQIAADSATVLQLSKETLTSFFAAFSFGLGEKEQEAISEFFRYSYYHGVIGDVPDLNFLDLPVHRPGSVN